MRVRSRMIALAMPLMLCVGAQADEQQKSRNGDEKLRLHKTIDVQGNGLGAFDISFVDPSIELYVLADRTNASVDLFDSEEGKFIGRIGSLCTPQNAPNCFQGVVLENGAPNNDVSGPDGVVIVDHKEIWAGDGDSRVKVIDIATRSFVTTISTGDPTNDKRVDEMAYDSRDHILAAANNAASPPFITLFDTTSRQILKDGKLVFQTGSANADVDAQNGIEQPQWSPETGLFYVSVPQVGSDPSIGGVSVIDPHSKQVIRTLLVRNCGPAGLTLGPRHEALIGCSGAFGSPKSTQSLIIDITSTSAGVNDAVVASVPIGGSDEVWFDKGTGHYFLAGRNNLKDAKPDPILGSIDARTHTLDPSASTSTTALSVAADKNSHLVFVPIGRVPAGSPSTTDPTNPCRDNGCVAVYRAHRDAFMEARDDDNHD